jgi:DNA-binding transcriptional ArsR family regulator
MTEDVRIAEVAALVGDPARANILTALMGRRALTAGELVHVAGVAPQTTSGHLAKLADGGLIACVKQGRHRYYRIATPRVAEMLTGIMGVIADLPPRLRRPSKLDEAMRNARTCYDHVAGKLGVGITDALCARGHVTLSDDGGELNESGVVFFKDFGVDLVTARTRAGAALLRSEVAAAHARQPRIDRDTGRTAWPEGRIRTGAVDRIVHDIDTSIAGEPSLGTGSGFWRRSNVTARWSLRVNSGGLPSSCGPCHKAVVRTAPNIIAYAAEKEDDFYHKCPPQKRSCANTTHL